MVRWYTQNGTTLMRYGTVVRFEGRVVRSKGTVVRSERMVVQWHGGTVVQWLAGG